MSCSYLSIEGTEAFPLDTCILVDGTPSKGYCNGNTGAIKKFDATVSATACAGDTTDVSVGQDLSIVRNCGQPACDSIMLHNAPNPVVDDCTKWNDPAKRAIGVNLECIPTASDASTLSGWSMQIESCNEGNTPKLKAKKFTGTGCAVDTGDYVTLEEFDSTLQWKNSCIKCNHRDSASGKFRGLITVGLLTMFSVAVVML